MRKVLWLIVCLMTMITSVKAHNVHYPTYTIDDITYVTAEVSKAYIDGVWYEQWAIIKVDKPNDKTITIPYYVEINGEVGVVWVIREEAFSTCVSLDSLIISDGIVLGNCFKTFKGCNKLEYLYYSYNGYWGGWNCGDGRGQVTEMTYSGLKCKTLETTFGCGEKPFWREVGSSIEKLIIRDTNRFSGTMKFCGSLKTIVCYATDTPIVYASADNKSYTCEDNKFQSWQWATITLYVPRESLEKFYFDRVWGEIDNIYAIDEMETREEVRNTTTSINAINNTTTKDDVLYSVNGIKTDKPTKGIYIKNGKKYIIK